MELLAVSQCYRGSGVIWSSMKTWWILSAYLSPRSLKMCNIEYKITRAYWSYDIGVAEAWQEWNGQAKYSFHMIRPGYLDGLEGDTGNFGTLEDLKDWSRNNKSQKGNSFLLLVNHGRLKINVFLHIHFGKKAQSGRNNITPTLKKFWIHLQSRIMM